MQKQIDMQLKWNGAEDICLGDVIKCGNHIGVVYWSDYFKNYQVSVGTGLTLCDGNMDRLEFLKRGNDKTCDCGYPYPPDGYPYPVDRLEKPYCHQCGKNIVLEAAT